MSRSNRILWFAIRGAAILLLALTAFTPTTAIQAAPSRSRLSCDDNNPLCTEVDSSYNYEGQYTGHDEPSVLFYDNRPGSGNSNVYGLTLPKDPPKTPTQDGTGGTDNFQLHPAFWFGMDLCDSQSAPEFTNVCTPNTDANIFTSTDPNSPNYIGKAPGGAFMEMQFYPPGWAPWPAGNSCDATKWCAALNIDSLGLNQNTNVPNNAACLSTVGEETVNFAFITRSGHSQAPANPVDATLATYTPDPSQDLFMNSGDKLVVTQHDTPRGFQVVIVDLTTRQTGSMTASIANGFAQVKYDPTATTCTAIPYAFHPMYSTSSENTRLMWTAHSYNVAFSDEIGHFEYCNGVDANGNCTAAGVNDNSTGLDPDDVGCFSPADSTLVQVGGCLGTDFDFDGVPYQNVWPGTNPNPVADHQYHPTPILFTSPLFVQSRMSPGFPLQNYQRVAFEVDMPRIELNVNPPCNRTTGANCTNPPLGANFYPFFTTTRRFGTCTWQEGGAFIPGTVNKFGGSSTTEFGSLLSLNYPTPGGANSRFNDFRQVLPNNPCPQNLLP